MKEEESEQRVTAEERGKATGLLRALNKKLKQNISGNENKKDIFNSSFAFTVDMENGVSWKNLHF